MTLGKSMHNHSDTRIVTRKYGDDVQADSFGLLSRGWGYAKVFFSHSFDPNKLMLEHNVLR